MLQALAGQIVQKVPQIPVTCLGPAVNVWPGDAVGIAPYIQGRDQAARSELIQPACKKAGIRHTQTTDHHAFRTLLQALQDIGFAPHATTGLHGLRGAAYKGKQGAAIGVFSIAGCSEVNHVQPGRSRIRVVSCQLQWRFIVDLALAEIAVQQAHHASIQQVDSGNQLHGNARKFSNKRAPHFADRSG